MYEYIIWHKPTNQQMSIFGRTYEQACNKWGVNPKDCDCLIAEYVD